MQIARVEGATRVLGASQGYIGLPVRDEPILDCATGQVAPSMVTAWHPTPDEVARIAAGAPIYLRVLGTVHPPVLLEVGAAPQV